MKTFSFRNFLNEEALDKALSPNVRSAIIDKGGKIYQIGGVVRDEMLGKVSKDLDLLVVGIDIKELGKIIEPFGKVNLVGKSFGVLKFKPEGSSEEIDISVPRIDEKSTGKGHKDFEIKLGKGISLEQDQLRRDFWMNAMSKDIETGEVHDMGGRGKLDIENRVVRMINPQAFQDDPLRMLRAVQFAARFDFKIEPKTYKEIKNNAKLIKTVSAERFHEEFVKMFTKSTKPSYGIKLMIELGLMKFLFPQVRKVSGLVDKIPKANFPAFLAVMLKDLGNQAGKAAQKVMRVSNNDAESIDEIVRVMTNKKIQPSSKNEFAVVKWVENLNSYVIDSIDGYLQTVKSQTIANLFRDMKRKGKPTNRKELVVDGRDIIGIGIKGPKVGKVLDWALEYSIRKGNQDKEKLLKAIQREA
jgi:tRNA nucleotidyltransferase/poly(A) polymerase